MDRFLYTGARTHHISFPLGGIGAGGIGLAGNGHLIDWEIYNRPNKGSVNGFSHFAVRVEDEKEVLDARILQGDLSPHFMGDMDRAQFRGYGFGPRREYLSGLPHFRDVAFRGEYPLAHLSFQDDTFPGEVSLLAFSPFIPLNEDDSSLPGAFFEIELTNTQDRPLTYTVVGVLSNPLPTPNRNVYNGSLAARGIHLLHLSADGADPDDPAYGTLSLATDTLHQPDLNVSWQEYWFRGAWFDNLEVYWQELTTPGPLQNRRYAQMEAGEGNEGMLAVHAPLAPGVTRTVRFVIAWHFPNCRNDWNDQAVQAAAEKGIANHWRNYYATLWPDSQDSACYAIANWERLRGDTVAFKEALFASSLPPAALDAVASNLSTLKTPVVKRLEDGTLYGFEGAHADAGCCEGSCTHVWNYQQTVPFLFPNLERSMRTADYQYNLGPDGGMPFRMMLPLGTPREGVRVHRACADGQFGGVMKTYRDWKISGDTAWLQSVWPRVKKSLEYAWHPDNQDRWDPEQTGVLWGRQHHTLDMELFGPNAWLTGFYLGALKAGAAMAAHLGEEDSAALYRTLFARGKAWADRHLFNGEYYQQQIDLGDKSLLEPYRGDDTLQGSSVYAAYWADEFGELKYQIGEGCNIDQVLAQWHANLYGLGEIYDPDQVRQANEAIFRINFKDSSRHDYNPCRIYSLNDEAGLIIAVWPEGKQQPVIPLPYSQETMNGYEYAAAIHMLQNGMVTEGMQAVTALRDRYDGAKRNPWNEIECGSNYARSMAAYALLHAFAGFEFDMVEGMVGFRPLDPECESFRCFWSLASGWGLVEIEPERFTLRVLHGSLQLTRLHLPLADTAGTWNLHLGDHSRQVQPTATGSFLLAPALAVTAEAPLSLRRTGISPEQSRTEGEPAAPAAGSS